MLNSPLPIPALARPLILAALALAAAIWPGGAPALAGENPVVVELFTSQGCSSCPPADRYLGKLAKRKDVIALSFHVNYWDYIGWPDPFASRETTQRQRDYSQTLKQRYVYTPELIVDGQAHSSRPADIERRIAEARGRQKLAVAFGKGAQGMRAITIPAGEFSGRASVWLVFYDAKRATKILRGENRGQTLDYYNVVRELRHIGTWTGQALTIPISFDEAESAGRGGCAVIVQEGRTGRILGAANLAIGG